MGPGCEAIIDSRLVCMPHEQTHGAINILEQAGTERWNEGSQDQSVMKLIADSLSVAKLALAELPPGAGLDKPALLSWQCICP